MMYYAAKDGVWQISEGSDTPTLSIGDAAAGTHVKVTCNFTARTMSDDNGQGFYYRIVSNSASALTPVSSVFQGCDGWQTATLVGLFEVTTTDDETTFSVVFDAGDMDGKGTLLNFTLLAET
ncbi:MAG: hypothetical protein ACPG7F_14710 [Aggregatilineales bacterium]